MNMSDITLMRWIQDPKQSNQVGLVKETWTVCLSKFGYFEPFKLLNQKFSRSFCKAEFVRLVVNFCAVSNNLKKNK